nr:MAG TPA: tail fiber protein [Caudoviricetes sp.]
MLSKDKNVSRFQYSQDVSSFSFDFPFWANNQIKVYASSPDGAISTLKEGQDYILSDPSDSGKVTLVQPLEGCSQITIARDVDIIQDTDFKNGEPIDADNIENVLDSIVAMIQQINEMLSRSILLPISDEGQSFTIPSLKERAEMVLGFDETGKAFKVYVNPQEALDTAERLRDQMQQSLDYIKGMESFIRERLARAYQETIGDGASLEYTVNHNLGTQDIVVQLWSTETEGLPIYEISIMDDNSVKVSFEEAIGSGAVSVVVTSIKETYIKVKDVQYEDIAPETFDKMAIPEKQLSEIIGG